jgi:hypothetical protein
MIYSDLEGYYSTLNLVIKLFDMMDLSEDYFARIYKLGDLIESAYFGNVPVDFVRDDEQIMSNEELYKGMLLDRFGNLIINDFGDCVPDPNYSVLKKRTFFIKRNELLEIS